MKRVLTTVIGLPIVIAFFVLSNQYIIDVLFAILLILAMHEYFGCIKNGVKPVQWIGYLMAVFVAFLHIIPVNIMKNIAIMAIPTILTILYLQIIITNMKYSFEDISLTFTGILYLFGFTIFMPILYGMKGNSPTENGKILIWYIFLASWGSDVFAYLIGRHGTHKFSKVSPNKTIEGSIGGIICGGTLALAFGFLMKMPLSLWQLAVISYVLSSTGQIGDLTFSSIKRYFDVKDYSQIFPGHGGVLDRFDSIIFNAMVLGLLLNILL